MAYSVPFASSPPLTPESKRSAKNRFHLLNSTASTTPSAPPPPSSAASFTPAGPPPSTVFGSSQLGSQQSLFGSQANGQQAQSPISFTDTRKNVGTASALSAGRAMASQTGQGVKRSLFSGLSQARSQQSPQSNSNARGRTETNDGVMSFENDRCTASEQDMELDFAGENGRTDSRASNSMSLYDWAQHGVSTRSPKVTKHRKSQRASLGRGDRGIRSYSALYSNPASRAKLKRSILPTLVRSTTTQMGLPELLEPQSLIMETEREARQLYPSSNDAQEQEELLKAAVQKVSGTLVQTWQKYCKQDVENSDFAVEEVDPQIGPRDDLPSYHKASFTADFLLKLYHPPSARGKQALPSLRGSQAALIQSAHLGKRKLEAYPKVLFDWLHANHSPYAEVFNSVYAHQPNASSHPSFWDMVLSYTIRGQLVDVARLLSQANFQYARSAVEDGFSSEGYSANVLNLVDRETQRVIQTLKLSPPICDDDWDLRSLAWTEFRQKVEDALQQLTAAAAERTAAEPAASAFDPSRITLRSSVAEFAKSTKPAEVKVPRTIFHNLRQLYQILLGKTNEILAAATDWLEATIALTAWWDGEDEEKGLYSLSASQSSRLIDIDTGAAYRKRLAQAFERTTGEGDGLEDTWNIDTSNTAELALASVFEGNLEDVMGLLQSFSLPIASAVIEIGSQARWYKVVATDENADELDNDDLMVLNYGHSEQMISKSSVLSTYAERLFEIQILKWNGVQKEGWELAIEILSRMDNIATADAKISELVARIQVDSDQRADTLIELCRTFSLESEAIKVSKNYADNVAETGERYGTALIYYARAHNARKVQDVLTLLISYSLVQSTSFPALSSLDPHLTSLLKKPRESLLWLSSIDPRAAEILSINMSGYATLRKFYDTRDEAIGNKRLSTSRKKSAVAALVTIIASASSWISGGLYDPSSDAVVPFEALFVLLGEVMPFLDTRVRYLSLEQIMVLLRAIEDVQTVHSQVRARCEECLKAALASARGIAYPADPQTMLKKSVSSGLTGSSGFSLLGASMEMGKAEQAAQRGNDVRRGWDWREGLQVGDGADQMIGMLRLGLAREVARAWLDGEELLS